MPKRICDAKNVLAGPPKDKQIRGFSKNGTPVPVYHMIYDIPYGNATPSLTTIDRDTPDQRKQKAPAREQTGKAQG